MNMLELRKKAKNLGVSTYRKKKPQIIREIQAKEGNFPCFGTARGFCDQLNCLWRSDCLK
ncbi:SAP domain-containing protein [Candidatus Aerophobetes bacterium]|nr:SAP domain-containing protein [Candidatus Aerophobetes bacterium]